jgi:glycerol-3-phosphate dehydrogenase
MKRDKSVLNIYQRESAIKRMASEEFDLLVIGGGINGAGIALDAATRGLKVALIEADDYASGTSSRSSKLIHGGLRYLEQANFKLVREALKERELMVKYNAPHLVKPVSFIYPLQKKFRERTYVGAGLALYDALRGFQRALPNHKHLGIKEIRRVAPCLDEKVVTGGIEYYDAQVDDARHTMMILRTASMYGALVANSVEAISLSRSNRRVVGAQAKDVISGDDFNIRAKATIIAAGVWSNVLFEKFGIKSRYSVTMSKGIHLIFEREAINLTSGLIIKTATSVLFVIPWGKQWMVGTTDTEYSGDRNAPHADEADVAYILLEVNKYLKTKLTKDQIIGVFAGLRPLVAPSKTSSTAEISREHVVDTPEPGLVTIAGGKYTTYRTMSVDAVDAIKNALQRAIPESVTKSIGILGAEGFNALSNSIPVLSQELGFSNEVTSELLNRYGSEIYEVAKLTDNKEYLREPIAGDVPYLKVEFLYAAAHEGARNLIDILARRTRISFEHPEASKSFARTVAELVAENLKWDENRIDAEVASYLQFLQNENAALFVGLLANLN